MPLESLTWGDVVGGILGGLTAGAALVAGLALLAARFKAVARGRRQGGAS